MFRYCFNGATSRSRWKTLPRLVYRHKPRPSTEPPAGADGKLREPETLAVFSFQGPIARITRRTHHTTKKIKHSSSSKPQTAHPTKHPPIARTPNHPKNPKPQPPQSFQPSKTNLSKKHLPLRATSQHPQPKMCPIAQRDRTHHRRPKLNLQPKPMPQRPRPRTMPPHPLKPYRRKP